MYSDPDPDPIVQTNQHFSAAAAVARERLGGEGIGFFQLTAVRC